MKVELMKFIDHEELSREVEQQYGLENGEINVLELFYEYCENGSYQPIYFDEDSINDEKSDVEEYPDDERLLQRLLVLTYLHDIFPEDDMVLWHCAW
ncbi:MAG: hypothetical protein E7270_01835 [Lachnospiraceae bacterium]|nr:hypothetical protein [Lachnospiraceae bacterium]